MNNINTILNREQPRTVGVITAHPDDDITHGAILDILAELGTDVHELTLSDGTKSTKNYTVADRQTFSVRAGDRRNEGYEGSKRLDIKSNLFAGAKDGSLQNNKEWLAAIVGIWAIAYGIDTFLTLGFTDHPDHIASNAIAKYAAASLYQAHHPIDILEIQHYSYGDLVAPATPNSVNRILYSALAHESQIRLTSTYHHDWTAITANFSMHPDDYAELSQYPLIRDAHYTYHAAGSLALSAI